MWQAIETAPKDGTRVLLWTLTGHEVAWWLANKQQWHSGHPYYAPEPTHWMPLPPAPGAAQSPNAQTKRT